jgi:hypothetical protein
VAPKPTTSIPTKKTRPAPAGLSPSQTYSVSLATTNAIGGFNTVSPLERLSVLPSAKQPMLVELGVIKGGRKALFAVQPGSLVGGPGECIPGPINCQLLALAPGQTEELSRLSATGAAVPVDLFAITQIAASRHGSRAAAAHVRNASSATGRALLANSPLTALPLFKYLPSVGAIVDLRNLSVGGN